MEWQPIETAPLGLDLLLLTSDGSVTIGVKVNKSGHFRSSLEIGDHYSCADYPNDGRPIKWQFVPAPPEAEK